MYNIFTGKVIAARHLCAARHAAVQRYAFFKQLRPSRAVYAAITAPAADVAVESVERPVLGTLTVEGMT